MKHIVLTRLCIVFIRLSSKERFYQIWRIMLHGALLRENKSYCRVVSPSQQLIILAVLHLYPVVSRAGVLRSSAVKILCKLFYEHFSINGSCSLIVCVVESEMTCFWFQSKSTWVGLTVGISAMMPYYFFLTSLYMRTRSSRLVAWGIQVYELLLLLIFFTLSRSVIPTEDKFILEAKLQYYWLSWKGINPLIPKRDWRLISPHNITPE